MPRIATWDDPTATWDDPAYTWDGYRAADVSGGGCCCDDICGGSLPATVCLTVPTACDKPLVCDFTATGSLSAAVGWFAQNNCLAGCITLGYGSYTVLFYGQLHTDPVGPPFAVCPGGLPADGGVPVADGRAVALICCYDPTGALPNRLAVLWGCSGGESGQAFTISYYDIVSLSPFMATSSTFLAVENDALGVFSAAYPMDSALTEGPCHTRPPTCLPGAMCLVIPYCVGIGSCSSGQLYLTARLTRGLSSVVYAGDGAFQSGTCLARVRFEMTFAGGSDGAPPTAVSLRMILASVTDLAVAGSTVVYGTDITPSADWSDLDLAAGCAPTKVYLRPRGSGGTPVYLGLFTGPCSFGVRMNVSALGQAADVDYTDLGCRIGLSGDVHRGTDTLGGILPPP